MCLRTSPVLFHQQPRRPRRAYSTSTISTGKPTVNLKMSAQLNHTKRKASSSPERSSFHDRPLPKPPPTRDRPITVLDAFIREERHPIYNRFCSLLPIAEISLSRTCTKFANVYQDLVPGQWNVDRRRWLGLRTGKRGRGVDGDGKVRIVKRLGLGWGGIEK